MFNGTFMKYVAHLFFGDVGYVDYIFHVWLISQINIFV